MYIKIVNNFPVSYSIEQLRKDNPQTSFPSVISDSLLAEYSVYAVQPVSAPVPSVSEALEEGVAQQAGMWVQSWSVRAMTSTELASVAAEKDEQKRISYTQEADPLFFKWQRGESTEQAWRDKVIEIKNRA